MRTRVLVMGAIERTPERTRATVLVVIDHEVAHEPPDDRQLSLVFERERLRPVARALPRVIEAEVVKSAARAA